MEYSVPIPANAAVGDVILVFLLGVTANTPAGWTPVTGSVLGTPWNIWRRTIVAGDAGKTVQFGFISSALVAACVVHVSGTTGVDVVGTVGTTPNALATSLAAASITPTGSSDLLLCFWIVARAQASITLPAGLTLVNRANGLRNTRCVNGHIRAAADWAANNNLCPDDNAALSAVIAGAPSIVIGSKALTSNAATGNQTATWTGGSIAMAVQIALAGANPIVAYKALTTQ